MGNKMKIDKNINFDYCILKKDLASKNIKRLVALTKQIEPSEIQYWSEENVMKDLPGKWFLSQAAFDHKYLVGYLIASLQGKDMAKIHKYVVDKDYRNLGIGRNLLYRLVEICLGINIGFITLNVYKVNKGAIKYHTSNGFKVNNERDTMLGVNINMHVPTEELKKNLSGVMSE